mmetsp:Transcript_113440/g.321033  ORF Transcript_113440/g.321033 Transcript_113440/m.321033 type:complete len:201 (-) Transcript_113440:1076-1678(-)
MRGACSASCDGTLWPHTGIDASGAFRCMGRRDSAVDCRLRPFQRSLDFRGQRAILHWAECRPRSAFCADGAPLWRHSVALRSRGLVVAVHRSGPFGARLLPDACLVRRRPWRARPWQRQRRPTRWRAAWLAAGSCGHWCVPGAPDALLAQGPAPRGGNCACAALGQPGQPHRFASFFEFRIGVLNVLLRSGFGEDYRRPR